MYVMTIDQRGSSADVDRVPASWRSWPACPRPGASSAPWATRSRASWSGRTKSSRLPCTPCGAAAGTWESAWARWTCRCLPARGKDPGRPSWQRARPSRTPSPGPRMCPSAVVSGGPAQGRGRSLARGISRCPRLRQRRGGVAADRTARPGPDCRPMEGRGCAALSAAGPLRHARHAENRCPGTGNHRTIGEPCAAALRLAGRMGGEAGGGNAAVLRPRSNHRQRRRRRAACGRRPGTRAWPGDRIPARGTAQKETGERPLDHPDPAHCRLRRLARDRAGLPARPDHRRPGRTPVPA